MEQVNSSTLNWVIELVATVRVTTIAPALLAPRIDPDAVRVISVVSAWSRERRADVATTIATRRSATVRTASMRFTLDHLHSSAYRGT